VEIFRRVLDAGPTAKDSLDQIDPNLLPQLPKPEDSPEPFDPQNPEDWVEKMKKIQEDNQEKNHEGESCPAPSASNQNDPPTNSQNGDNDSQGDSTSEDVEDIFKEITSESVLEGMSKNNLKHSQKHLTEFQALDPNITENSLRKLGASIVKPENMISNPNASQKLFEKIVDIGGHPTKIRVALNERNKLHSIHIRYK
jgi:hypothetical protein